MATIAHDTPVGDPARVAEAFDLGHPPFTAPADPARVAGALAAEDPTAFTVAGVLHADVPQKLRSGYARARLAAAWPATGFQVRTVSTTRTSVAWSDGPSPRRVMELLEDLLPGGGKDTSPGQRARPGRWLFERTTTVKAVVFSQLVVAETTGAGYLPLAERRRDGHGDYRRTNARDNQRRGRLYSDVRRALFAGSHRGSSLRVDADVFARLDGLVDLVLALIDGDQVEVGRELHLAQAVALVFDTTPLDTLAALQR